MEIDKLRLSLPEDWKEFNDYRKNKTSGFKTGLASLDAQLPGLTGIVGFQGAPGCCKSTLALQIAAYNAATGVPVLIIDRENGRNRFKSRILSQIAGATTKQVKEASDRQVYDWYAQLKDWPLYIEHSEVSTETIREYLGQIRERYQKPLLLVIDSLQALPQHQGMDERNSLQKWMLDFDQMKLDYKDQLVIIVTIEKKVGTYEEGKIDAGKGTGSIGYKCELLFDIREGREAGILPVALVKARDGAKFTGGYFRQLMADASDQQSFIFKLDYTHAQEEY